MNSTQQAQAFFYEHAGWSQSPGESKHQGKTRCAKALAKAEARATSNGYSFAWDIDPDSNSSDFSNRKPYYDLWFCLCRDASGHIVASLYAIDFGAGGSPWGQPYRRVVEAELASEALSAVAA